MKKINVVISALAISIAVFGMFSCKKTDNKDNPVCKMTSAIITPSSGTNAKTYTFTYDNGKLSSIVGIGSGALSRIFNYSGNVVNTTVKDEAGAILGMEEIVLNNANKISSITKEDASGKVKEVQTFYFDANGNLQETITAYASGEKDTVYCTFVDGNLISTKSAGSSTATILSYYTDKPWASGDYLNFYQFCTYGNYGYINKNLVKAMSSGSVSTEFTYEFNSAGRITKMYMKNNGTLVNTLTYSYDCQ